MRFLGVIIAALIALSAGPSHAAEVSATRTVDGVHQPLTLHLPFQEVGSVARADLGTDGTDELLIASGLNEPPTIAVLRLDGSLIGSFPAYGPSFQRGIYVAAGDITGDGLSEIVTGTFYGGGPHVRVFDRYGVLVSQFFAYDQAFRGGVSVAIADINHDGRNEIVTAPGPTGGPHIRAFQSDGTLVTEYFSSAANDTNGLVLDVVSDTLTINDFDEFDVGTLTIKRGNDIITIATRHRRNARRDRHIYVNLDEQRLYAYNYGLIDHTYLISSGRPGFPTPVGEFAVMRKLHWHDYKWYDRAGNLLYNLPNVEYNLEFKRHYYIHYAYWHNNFGRRMSGGCVNAPYDGVKETYAWADVGTPVVIE